MGKKRTAAQFFNDIMINSYEPLHKTNINGDTVVKRLKGGTKLNYK